MFQMNDETLYPDAMWRQRSTRIFRIRSSVFAAVLAAVVASGPDPGTGSTHPGEGRENGKHRSDSAQTVDRVKPSRLDYDTYFKMADPREAARLLREDMIWLGRDLNMPFPPPGRKMTEEFRRVLERPHVHLIIGDRFFDEGDSSLVLESRGLIAQGRGDELVVCLIQFNAGMTPNDLISVMERGVRVFKGIPFMTYIARLRMSEVEPLTREPFIRCVVRYEPSYKYRKERIEDGRWTDIISLDDDKPEFREDLISNGLSEFEYVSTGSSYVATAGRAQVERLTLLWWVEKVFQDPPTSRLSGAVSE